jgi:hypothetical protein
MMTQQLMPLMIPPKGSDRPTPKVACLSARVGSITDNGYNIVILINILLLLII